MSSSNRTIAELAAWAANPVQMARFEAVALLTQRTSFVQSLLGLADHPDLIRAQIQRICDKQGVQCKVPRGATPERLTHRTLGPEVRYHASFLLCTLLATRDPALGGLEDQGIIHDGLVDRLVYAYRRYLSTFLLQPDSATVGFELFYQVYKAYCQGEVTLRLCDNCGAGHISLRSVAGARCPLCHVQRLAQHRPPAAPPADEAAVAGLSCVSSILDSDQDVSLACR